MCTTEDRYHEACYDRAVQDGRIERYAIHIAFTAIIDDEEYEGCMDCTHDCDANTAGNLCEKSILWFENYCDVGRIHFDRTLPYQFDGMDLSGVAALVDEFTFDVDWTRE